MEEIEERAKGATSIPSSSQDKEREAVRARLQRIYLLVHAVEVATEITWIDWAHHAESKTEAKGVKLDSTQDGLSKKRERGGEEGIHKGGPVDPLPSVGAAVFLSRKGGEGEEAGSVQPSTF